MIKIILLCIFTISASSIYSQDVFTYYFIEVRVTGKGDVEIAPEGEASYTDIADLIETKREKDKKGFERVTGKKYNNYSAAFNVLSKAGLEFVQFTNLPTVGGATSMFVGTSLPTNYMIWRKKVQ